MLEQHPALKDLCLNHSDDIERLIQDVQNGYSFAKVSFIYSRLKTLGPWKPEDFSMELIFEIDMMQSALAVEYARIFSGGARKVGRNKVPEQLRPVHDSIMDLRNKRYAHNDGHASVENFADLIVEDGRILFRLGAGMQICLGAPAEWDELIKWLGEYLFKQSEEQLRRLTEKTGFEWVQPMGPPPEWL